MADAARFDVVSSSQSPTEEIRWPAPDTPPPPGPCDWRTTDLFVRASSLGLHVVESSRFLIMDESGFQKQPTRVVDFCGNEGPLGLFDIRANDDQCLVEVKVRIFLDPLSDDIAPVFRSEVGRCGDETRVATPEAVAEQQDEWLEMIRNRWSRKHQIRALGVGCPCPAYDVDVDVEFVADEAQAHHTVHVHSGCERPDSQNWFIDMQPSYAAHEFGHLLGLLDEYPKPREMTTLEEIAFSISDPLDILFERPRSNCELVTSARSIMWNSGVANYLDGEARVYPFHYHFFAEWLARTRCCEFEIGSWQDIKTGERFKSL